MPNESEKLQGGRLIVTEWLDYFDPAPQINFQQSECLQALIDARIDSDASTIEELRAEVERLKRFEKLDREAATYVETVLCMRTHFTGEPPYVGWKGLGLALTETLDALRAKTEECERCWRKLEAADARLARAAIQAEAKAAAEVPPPVAGEEARKLYRHKKRGTVYEIVGRAFLQVTKAAADNCPVVVYRNVGLGDLWVRPSIEFFDGRFEELGGVAPPPPPADLKAEPVAWLRETPLGLDFTSNKPHERDVGKVTPLYTKEALSAAHAAGKAEGEAETSGPREREEGVDEILGNYRQFIGGCPELISLLYDIDMLPEQCRSYVGAVRLASLCEVWKRGDAKAATARAEALAEAQSQIRKWLKTDHMLLHAGEMSAQEKRTVKAVLAAIILELGALAVQPPAPREET